MTAKKRNNRNKRHPRGGHYTFSIAGPHGVGKSTAFRYLERKYGARDDHWYFLPERLREVPPVPFGSKDPQVAFLAEIHFIQQMVERNEKIAKVQQRHPYLVTVVDRTPACVLVYTEALGFKEDSVEFSLIHDLYNSVRWQEDFVLYLEASLETIAERILRRGKLVPERVGWNEEDFDYLRRVLALYEKYLRKPWLKHKVVRVDTEGLRKEEVAKEVEGIILERSQYGRYGTGRLKTASLVQFLSKTTT
ncbi:MAG: hypothetical protein Kow0069_09010 [Promethearchaeota archaeon]